METKDNLVESGALDHESQAAQNATNENAAAQGDKIEGANSDVGTHQEHIKEALELLYVHFPKAFIKEGDCKPLKVGILEDLKSRISNIEGLSISKVRAAVRVYTTRLRYFYSVREGAMRVDLDGNEIEAVSAEHAEYARSRFTEINAKRRPAKPKKPARSFNKGKRPNNQEGGEGQGGRNFRQDGKGRFNRNQNGNRPFNRNGGQGQQRRFEPAKESDIRVGRHVFLSHNHGYLKATVDEVKPDQVRLTLINGSSVTMNPSNLFVQSQNRPKRNFHNNGNGGHRNNQGFRGGPRRNNNDERQERNDRPRNDHANNNHERSE